MQISEYRPAACVFFCYDKAVEQSVSEEIVKAYIGEETTEYSTSRKSVSRYVKNNLTNALKR